MTGFLLVSAISILTTAGALLIVRWSGWTGLESAIAPGLAAGVMLWIAAVEVAPATVAALGWPATVVAMGLGAVMVGVGARLARRSTVVAGVAPVLGVALVLHDLPEGFAVGALLGGVGLAAALPMIVAVAAHNLPEKLALLAPSRHGATVPSGVLVAATLPEPLGAAIAGAGAAAAPVVVVTVAVAVAGGMMAAVALGTLPTVARRASTMRPFLGAGAAGALSMAALGVVLPG